MRNFPLYIQRSRFYCIYIFKIEERLFIKILLFTVLSLIVTSSVAMEPEEPKDQSVHCVIADVDGDPTINDLLQNVLPLIHGHCDPKTQTSNRLVCKSWKLASICTYPQTFCLPGESNEDLTGWFRAAREDAADADKILATTGKNISAIIMRWKKYAQLLEDKPKGFRFPHEVLGKDDSIFYRLALISNCAFKADGSQAHSQRLQKLVEERVKTLDDPGLRLDKGYGADLVKSLFTVALFTDEFRYLEKGLNLFNYYYFPLRICSSKTQCSLLAVTPFTCTTT